MIIFIFIGDVFSSFFARQFPYGIQVSKVSNLLTPESMKKKMIVIFVLVALVFLGEIIKTPKTYREEEITEMLCKKILKKKNLEDQFVNIIDMQKTENSILVGYVIGNTEQIKTPGYLIF